MRDIKLLAFCAIYYDCTISLKLNESRMHGGMRETLLTRTIMLRNVKNSSHWQPDIISIDGNPLAELYYKFTVGEKLASTSCPVSFFFTALTRA